MDLTIEKTPTDRRDVTLAPGTIHNPSDLRHYMRLKPVQRRVSLFLGELLLAESVNALRVLEVGKDLYDPVLYLPREDVHVDLLPSARLTHCPLKGDASHYSVDRPGGADIAWSYERPFAFADRLRGLVAFYQDRLTIEEAAL